MNTLSVVLIAPHDARRRALATGVNGPQASVMREFSDYPTFETVAQLVDAGCDAVIVDLDPDAERALDLVEGICSANPSVTVMISSTHADPELLVRCMRAGARELLKDPISTTNIAEALVRTAARRMEVRRQKKTAGKLFVFSGAKGGAGVTTLASNFALALAQETGAGVLLVDMNIQLGDAAMALGLKSKYSIADVFSDPDRVDAELLGTLTTKHSSGLDVIAAPDSFMPMDLAEGDVARVLRIMREDYAYVVVDAGWQIGKPQQVLFALADAIYLVTQVEIAALRNAHRLICFFETHDWNRRLEIILNRFDARKTDIDASMIEKALTMPARWSAPNDYAAIRHSQNSGTPVINGDTPISRAILDMARAASGRVVVERKRKKFGLF